jgi:hypothetical protein
MIGSAMLDSLSKGHQVQARFRVSDRGYAQ